MNSHIRGPLPTVLFHFLLGAFRNFAISFDTPVYPSVCPSAWNISAAAGRIFMKFDFSLFFETLSRKFKFR
jgi:hypothetical protein